MDMAWMKRTSIGLLACVLAVGSVACGGDDETSSDDARVPGDGDGDGDADASLEPDGGELDAGDVDASEPLQPSGVRIYASVSGEHEVVVIDEGSREIVEHIPVGEGPAILLASPSFDRLYTANWRDNTVSSIERASSEVTSIQLTGRPYVIALSPSGDALYVGTNPTGIVVIDTATSTIDRTIPTEELAASLIVSPDGGTLYIATVPLAGVGSLRAISTETDEVIHEPIMVGNAPAWITITPDGSKVFALNFLSDDISVVDTTTFEIVETVDTGAGSQAIIGNVTPDGSTLFVTNHGSGELMGIDTESYAITQTIPLDGRPVGVQFNADGSRVYTTDFGTASLMTAPDLGYLLTGTLSATGPGQVRVFDTATGEEVGARVETGPGATSVVVYEP
jgi:YVTN family beta-propeller protein